MKKLAQLALIPLSLLALVACGPGPGEGEGEGEGPDFADETLTGTIDGQPWTLTAAATDDFLSDEDGFFTTFFGEPVEGDPCDFFGNPPKILHTIPPEVGTFTFNLRRNLTFVIEGEDGLENLIATSGGVRVDEIDEENALITGAVTATFDDNEVNGTFEATICPPN